ncbi:MAG TPA: hypothetical protein V6C97_11875 [Oculatellaceae cyanobacterium]
MNDFTAELINVNGMTTCGSEAAAANDLILRFRDVLKDAAATSPGYAQLAAGKCPNLTKVFEESDSGRLPTLNFAPDGRWL